jgi:hypothetical protein
MSSYVFCLGPCLHWWVLIAVLHRRFTLLFSLSCQVLCDSRSSLADERIYRKIRAGFRDVCQPGAGPWFNSDISVSEKGKDFIRQLLQPNVAERYDEPSGRK